MQPKIDLQSSNWIPRYNFHIKFGYTIYFVDKLLKQSKMKIKISKILIEFHSSKKLQY